MVKLLLFPGDKNDATTFYLEIIRDSLSKCGLSATFVESVSDITKGDTVVCIIPKSFWSVIRHDRNANILYWFQGVVPEEISYYNYSWIKKIVNKLAYTLMEFIILRKSRFNLFVSEAMTSHYKRKYGYNNDNYFVMPCFNQALNINAFNDSKYQTPSFVYTGNLAKWQCFEPMIILFSRIKKQIPQATLTIYTKDQDDARTILLKYGVSAEIKYVPYLQLAEEIKQYKYGFILRENNVVNNVATPTKMNSYLASGIIPIYTDVVGAYKENLSTLKYAVPLSVDNQGLEKLFQLEKMIISGDDVLADYKPVFDHYYNREKYVTELAKRIIRYC